MQRIPLFGVVVGPEVESAIIEVTRSGRIASGEYVGRFEAALGSLVGSSNVVTTSDMTNALALALRLAGVRAGDRVLTMPYACMATNCAIAMCGAVPLWVDFAPGSVEMSLTDLEEKLERGAKAVVLYHVAGYPGPAAEISELCKRHRVMLIEDCNNALLAERDGFHVGTAGDFAVYSFYPNRQINCSDGGALICRDEEMARRARKLRRFGIDAAGFRNSLGEIDPAVDIPEIGLSCPMNNLCAAMGFAQLAGVQLRMERTRRNAADLMDLASGIEGVKIVPLPRASNPAFWTLLLFVQERDRAIEVLRRTGVTASAMHSRNDSYSGFGALQEALPNTDFVQSSILAVPCGWWLSEEDVRYVGESIRLLAS
jgi:perosamine synthetase